MIQKTAHKPLRKAFVLHTRPYRETSTLATLFTKKYGRISALAKGSRHSKSAAKGLLQPFTPILIRWGGRGSLKTLNTIEPDHPFLYLKPNAIRIGLYLNELLMHTLPHSDKNEVLFCLYENSLNQIAHSENSAQVEKVLRSFEKKLLKELGYEINFAYDFNTHELISPKCNYRFSSFSGFTRQEHNSLKVSEQLYPQRVDFLRGVEERVAGMYTRYMRTASDDDNKVENSIAKGITFSGADLIAISNNDYSDANTLKAAKRLFKLALEPLLEGKTFKTRELFKFPSDND